MAILQKCYDLGKNKLKFNNSMMVANNYFRNANYLFNQLFKEEFIEVRNFTKKFYILNIEITYVTCIVFLNIALFCLRNDNAAPSII